MRRKGSARTRTLRWLLERYLEEKLLRPATQRMYTAAVDRWIAETGVTSLRGVTRQRVLAWRREVLSTRSPETWNKRRRHLRALFAFAMERGWVRRKNPFVEVGPAPNPNPAPRVVALNDLADVLARLDKGRSRVRPAWFWAKVIRCLYYTGMRRRQLAGLQWKDVHLSEAWIRLRAETSKTRRQWQIPMAEPVRQDLEDLRRRAAERLGRPPRADEQVFNVCLFSARYRGPEMSEDQLTAALKRIAAETGVPLSPHRLRHTAATQLCAAGDLRSAQIMLGHTSIQTTIRYVHPDLDSLRQTVEAMPSPGGHEPDAPPHAGIDERSL